MVCGSDARGSVKRPDAEMLTEEDVVEDGAGTSAGEAEIRREDREDADVARVRSSSCEEGWRSKSRSASGTRFEAGWVTNRETGILEIFSRGFPGFALCTALGNVRSVEGVLIGFALPLCSSACEGTRE